MEKLKHDVETVSDRIGLAVHYLIKDSRELSIAKGLGEVITCRSRIDQDLDELLELDAFKEHRETTLKFIDEHLV